MACAKGVVFYANQYPSATVLVVVVFRNIRILVGWLFIDMNPYVDLDDLAVILITY